MDEQEYDFQFQMTLSEAEIEKVLTAIKDAIGIQTGLRKANDPLSDCFEKTRKLRTYRKSVQTIVTGPIPVPTPVMTYQTCHVYETTTICPGQSEVTHQWEECS